MAKKPVKDIPHLDRIGKNTVLFALRYLISNYDDSHYAETGSLTEEEVSRLADLIENKTVLIPGGGV